MGRHVKKAFFKVGLDEEDAAVLLELVPLEQDLRRDPELGGATLLRDYGMPAIRRRLEQLKRAAAPAARRSAGAKLAGVR